MLEANIRIIAGLKQYLSEVISNESLLNQYRVKTSTFTRNRTLTFSVMVMLIINGLKRSLSVELQDFFGHIHPDRSCSKQAFSSMRSKLKAEFFQDWNNRLVTLFYRHHASHINRWKGLKVFSMDGSSVSIPDTKASREKYGLARHKKGGTPTSRFCVLYDVLNRIALKGGLYPFSTSESEMAREHLEDLPADAVVLFDRGYSSYWLLHLLLLRNPSTGVLMRCKRSFCKQVEDFAQGRCPDKVIRLYPSYKSIRKLESLGIQVGQDTPLKIRVARVLLPSGEEEFLITNLFDSKVYGISQLKELYNLRWGIETFYGQLKNELLLEQFSGIRNICMEQDFSANLFLANIQSLIEKQCDPYLEFVSGKRKYSYKVNKNISWALLKYRVVQVFLLENCMGILSELEKLFEKHLVPIRPGRSYPRTKKTNYANSRVKLINNYKRAI